MHPVNGELIRDLNRSLVLNLVREQGGLSRAAIARASGLSPSTVTAISSSLIADGYLLETTLTRPADGTPVLGRPATLLQVNPTAGYVVGIKVAAEAITAAVTDLGAETICTRTTPQPAALDGDSAAESIAQAVATIARDAGIDRAALLGVGIGVPGIVEPSTGRVTLSPLLEWDAVDVVGLVAHRTGLPVHIDNDVNTLTIAEQLFGSGRGLRDFLVVTVGSGIGMGAVLGGSPYRGASGGAGELGHVAAVVDGRLCWCGRRGCLETVASEPALVREVLAATGHLVAASDLGSLAGRDRRVAHILGHAGGLVGRAVANVATVLDPERVIVSGEGVRLGAAFLGPLAAQFEEGVSGRHRELELVTEPLGDEAWARGAATLVLRELFHPAHVRDERRLDEGPTGRARPIEPARAGRGGATR